MKTEYCAECGQVEGKHHVCEAHEGEDYSGSEEGEECE